MPSTTRAIVVFGDVVDSRREPAASSRFLRALADELAGTYPARRRLAAPGITQGDELQLLLAPDADPFVAVLRGGLRPDARATRWAIVRGDVDGGRGPATQRTGPAFLAARELLARMKAERVGLSATTGDAPTDALLADLAPLLPRLLGGLTDRQREAARLMLVEGLRRSDVADRLGVSRATVSVMAGRAMVDEIAGLARGLAALFAGARA